MPMITTFLTYDHQAEEAAKLYVSVFKNSRIRNVTRYGQAGPGPTGSVMTVTFELDGQEFVALNGGPHFNFTDGVGNAFRRWRERPVRMDHFGLMGMPRDPLTAQRLIGVVLVAAGAAMVRV